MPHRIGVDIGGTFTDLVVQDPSGAVAHAKALTTPGAPADAVLECLRQVSADLAATELLVHGTTVGINTVLERTGARTALITTKGFRDVLEIGRGNFHRMYDVLYRRPPPLVPRSLRLEADERLSATGAVLTPLDEAALRAAVGEMSGLGVEAVVIAFLFAYVDPRHERRAGEIVKEMLPGVAITMSHRVSQEWREYERTATAVLNGYIQPTLERYLTHLDRSLAEHGFHGQLLLTQSNGGACTADAALVAPVTSLESGPAAGVNGCAALVDLLQHDHLIAFDMGGTTTKCCLIDRGIPAHAEEYAVDGHPIRIPILDLKEVSAGGGTIAWIDAGGALGLGPRSAGAEPGPICYGRGGAEPTVTDANVVLGRIDASRFFGGRMALDLGRTEAGIDDLARKLGLDREATAAGILRLAAVKMALALKSITTDRGVDPRDYALVAYGGSGPLHAAFLARELGVARLIVPPGPSTFSAWGMLAADLRHDLVRTVFQPLGSTDAAWAGSRFEAMAAEVATLLPPIGRRLTRLAVDLRYTGQNHTVTVPLAEIGEWPSLRTRFDAAHRQAYGYAAPDVEVEVLNFRVTVTSPVERPTPPPLRPGDGPPTSRGTRSIYSLAAGASRPTEVYDREDLRAGHVVVGPAAIVEPSTTTILEPGDRMTVDRHGLLVIEIGATA